MRLLLKREYLKKAYTIGKLYIDGNYFCDTLEDPVRDLAQENKIPGLTAIPAGEYDIVVNISPKFRRKLPRLLDVPGFDGVLIHRGNIPEDTAGCILVGENRVVGKVINSARYELELTKMLESAQQTGDIISIEIK